MTAQCYQKRRRVMRRVLRRRVMRMRVMRKRVRSDKDGSCRGFRNKRKLNSV